jgi:transposase InsO family protein
VEPQLTIPFPPDFFEALAQRVAEILAERSRAQRYLDAEAAAAYLGIPVKTLRTKEWREREGSRTASSTPASSSSIGSPSMSASPPRAAPWTAAIASRASPAGLGWRRRERDARQDGPVQALQDAPARHHLPHPRGRLAHLLRDGGQPPPARRRRRARGAPRPGRPARFRARLAELGIKHRRGGYRDPESQAFIESWFGKLKEREVWLNEYETLEDARRRISGYVDRYHHRPHSRLGYKTPYEVKETWEDLQSIAA